MIEQSKKGYLNLIMNLFHLKMEVRYAVTIYVQS